MVAPSTGTTDRPASPPKLALIPPYHIVYLGLLLGPLTAFTLLSLFLQTHTYNVYLSSPHASSTGDVIAEHLKPVASIFAQRTNLLNRVFIKNAWAWTSVAWVAQALTLRGPESPEAKKAAQIAKGKAKADAAKVGGAGEDDAGPEDQEATVASPLAKSLLRYAIATSAWVCFSLWLFGPPLMERIFTSSGGVCVPRQAGDALDGLSNPSGEASVAGDVSAFRMPNSPIDEAFCRAGHRGISHSERPDLFKTAHLLVTEGIGSGRLRGVCESPRPLQRGKVNRHY